MNPRYLSCCLALMLLLLPASTCLLAQGSPRHRTCPGYRPSSDVNSTKGLEATSLTRSP